MNEGDITLMRALSEENRRLKEENSKFREEKRMAWALMWLCWLCWMVTLAGWLYAAPFLP